MSGQRRAHEQHLDSDDWVSGGEPMSDQQEAFLERLCEERGVRMDYELTKAQASRRIEELKDPDYKKPLTRPLPRPLS
jgi:hypothetical protein